MTSPSAKIVLNSRRKLVVPPTELSRPAFIYSASGLVKIGSKLYVVADDEIHLGEFDLLDDCSQGRWIRLLPGHLPCDYEKRKEAKADFECIAHLSGENALLIVPSLSRDNRCTGVFLRYEEPFDSPRSFDMLQLRRELSKQINGLNIEGIAVHEKKTRLFHRGSRKRGKNAVIELDTGTFLAELVAGNSIYPGCIISITEYELGEIENEMLGFTDALALQDGRTIFLCACEATDDEYNDGASLGSALGIMTGAGQIESLRLFDTEAKLEGVCIAGQDSSSNTWKLLLVSDTDDQNSASNLFECDVTL